MRYTIKEEYAHENPIYYHINEVVIDEQHGNMVKAHDIHDGYEFWIEKRKLAIV